MTGTFLSCVQKWTSKIIFRLFVCLFFYVIEIKFIVKSTLYVVIFGRKLIKVKLSWKSIEDE